MNARRKIRPVVDKTPKKQYNNTILYVISLRVTVRISTVTLRPQMRLFSIGGQTMENKKLHRLTAAALLAAFCFCATWLLKIPFLLGYIHLGDCFCLLAGWLLGPLYGALSAGIGSALADLVAGYPVYIPATFLIKAAMALLAHYVCKKRGTLVRRTVSAVSAELIMVAGYFLYECLLYGIAGAVPAISGNLLQAAGGILTATILWQVLVPVFKKNDFKF